MRCTKNKLTFHLKFFFQIEETDKARKNAEKLAREAAEKYNELKSKSLNIQNEKNFENLRETNTNLKNVSYLTIILD